MDGGFLWLLLGLAADIEQEFILQCIWIYGVPARETVACKRMHRASSVPDGVVAVAHEVFVSCGLFEGPGSPFQLASLFLIFSSKPVASCRAAVKRLVEQQEATSVCYANLTALIQPHATYSYSLPSTRHNVTSILDLPVTRSLLLQSSPCLSSLLHHRVVPGVLPSGPLSHSTGLIDI